jgi:Flp pilus assembly pilin Flp
LGVSKVTLSDETGQAFGEYAILVGGVAIVCAFVILLLGAAINGLFRGSGSNPSGVFQPPVTTPNLTWPKKIEECEDGGWRNFAQFTDEKECEEYVKSLTP